MTRLILCAALMLSISTALSQLNLKQISHKQAAEKLLEILNMKSQSDSLIAELVDLQVRADNSLKNKRTVMIKFFKKYVGWDALKDKYAETFMAEFSEEQLVDLSSFFSTPLGKIYVSKQIAMTRKMSRYSEETTKAHLTELEVLLEEK